MKKYSRILIIVNLILLLGYFNWSVYKKEQILKDGRLVLLQLVPVDPRSLMQGDYMRLNYKEASSNLPDEQTDTRGYAILRTDSNQVGEIVRLQNTLEPVNDNELVIRYKIINRRRLPRRRWNQPQPRWTFPLHGQRIRALWFSQRSHRLGNENRRT